MIEKLFADLERIWHQSLQYPAGLLLVSLFSSYLSFSFQILISRNQNGLFSLCTTEFQESILEVVEGIECFDSSSDYLRFLATFVTSTVLNAN